MTFDTPCPVCTRPITHEIPDSITGQFRERLFGMAAGVCHDGCFKIRNAQQMKIEQAAKEEARLANWCAICPPAYQNSESALIPDQAAHEQVLKWEFGPKGLTLFGPTGRGKTRSMFMLLRQHFEQFKTVLYFSHTDFAGRVISMMNDRRAADRWLALLMRVDVLFIDDLGKSKFITNDGGAKHSEEILFDVFEKRIGQKLPTMFTSNFDGRTLQEQMSPDRGEPFIRRLREFTAGLRFK